VNCPVQFTSRNVTLALLLALFGLTVAYGIGW
jgi:hypothetical protein